MDINKGTGDSFLLHFYYKVTEHLLFEKKKKPRIAHHSDRDD